MMSGSQDHSAESTSSSPWVDVAGRRAVWRSRALCAGLGPEVFFPSGDTCAEAVERAEAAKAVCGACPVRGPCLRFAISTNQQFGVWGGQTEEERRGGFRARPRRTVITVSAPAEVAGVVEPDALR